MRCNAYENRFTRAIEAILSEGSRAPPVGDLPDHLKECSPCRDYYNRVVRLERLLHGGPSALGPPSASELDRVAGWVLGEQTESPERKR